MSDNEYRQRTLINTNEIYMLTEKNLLKNGSDAIQAFYDQANKPNFKTSWRQVSNRGVLVPIRFRLNGIKHLLGYSQEECCTWPIVSTGVQSIRRIADDLKAAYSETRRTDTVFDLKTEVAPFRFHFKWKDQYVEKASVSAFHKIIQNFFPDMKMSAEQENNICKAFYLKLPLKNMFGIRFMTATKEYLKVKKRDTMQAIFMRLSDHLAAARTCVNDAADMGNSEFEWITPDVALLHS